MAREEAEREDLLAEAVALVERVELKLVSSETPIVAGFRRDGSASFFFGADPVYQFNSHHELRRAFRHGLLLKAERGRLVSLSRQRTASEVQLVRHELTDAETTETLGDAVRRLVELQQRLGAQDYTIVGQVPGEANIVSRIRTWLDDLPQPLTIAATPHVK